jgi:hypothetical protein
LRHAPPCRRRRWRPARLSSLSRPLAVLRFESAHVVLGGESCVALAEGLENALYFEGEAVTTLTRARLCLVPEDFRRRPYVFRESLCTRAANARRRGQPIRGASNGQARGLACFVAGPRKVRRDVFADGFPVNAEAARPRKPIWPTSHENRRWQSCQQNRRSHALSLRAAGRPQRTWRNSASRILTLQQQASM